MRNSTFAPFSLKILQTKVDVMTSHNPVKKQQHRNLYINYTAFLGYSSSPHDKSPTKHSFVEIPTLSGTEGIVIYENALFCRSADLKFGDFLV